MKKVKRFLLMSLVIILCFSFNMTAFAKQLENYNAEIASENYPPVTIGSRVGYNVAYGKGTVRVYVTLNQSYSKGVVVRAGATGNDTPYSCSVRCPDGTVRVLCSAELNNLHANGDRTDYFYISNGASGTYEFIFSMQDTTKTTACLAWIYEVTGYL